MTSVSPSLCRKVCCGLAVLLTAPRKVATEANCNVRYAVSVLYMNPFQSFHFLRWKLRNWAGSLVNCCMFVQYLIMRLLFADQEVIEPVPFFFLLGRAPDLHQDSGHSPSKHSTISS
jgi:hypothetical protein